MDDRKYVLLGYEPGTEEPVYKYTEDMGDSIEYGVCIDKSDENEYSAIMDEFNYEYCRDTDDALSYIYSNRERGSYSSSKWFKAHSEGEKKNRLLGFDPIFHWPVNPYLRVTTYKDGSTNAYEEVYLEGLDDLNNKLYKLRVGDSKINTKKWKTITDEFWNDSYCVNDAQKTYKETLYGYVIMREFIAKRRTFLILSDALNNDDVEAVKILGYEPNHNLPVYLISNKYIDLVQVGENRKAKYMPIVVPIPPNEIINGVSMEKALELVGKMQFEPVSEELVERIKKSEGAELTRLIFSEIFKQYGELQKTPVHNKATSTINSVDGKYTIHDVDQRSDEWYELRDGKVTGSQAYLLKTHSLEYVIEKSHGQSSSYISEAAKRGLDLEREGIDVFARLNNADVSFVGFVTSNQYALAGCSPDGVIYEDGTPNSRIKTIIEHKAFGAEHHIACHKCIDDKVMYQIQYNMFITGASDAYLILYNPDMPNKDDRLFIHKILPDEEIYHLFEEKLR